MQQTLLGWTVLTFGCLLMLRVLFMRNRTFSHAAGFLSVGIAATITGLWLLHYLNLPHTIERVFASL
ncbi:MAG: hypothetical protein ACYTG2_14685 [Planctomycetota bacterium]|jgi:hypothetical protein